MNKRTKGYILSSACWLSCATVLAQDTVWHNYRLSGETALAHHNYALAEKSFLLALQEAQKLGPKDNKLALSLADLALLYETRGQFAKAEPYYEQELRVQEKRLGPENAEIVTRVGKLVQHYLTLNKLAKADRLTNLLLLFANKKLKEHEVNLGHLKELAKFYDSNLEYRKASSLLAELKAVSEKVCGNQYLELAATLDTIGSLYKRKNKYSIAEQLYKRALKLRESVLVPEHMALAASLDNLASLYAMQGKPALAEPLYKQALAITEKTLKPQYPEVFQRLECLAQTYICIGRLEEAESLYKRALKVLAAGSGANGSDMEKSYLALGCLYVKEGKYAEAEPLFKRSLTIAEAINGPKHISLATNLDLYADLLEKTKRASEAAKLRARAHAIRCCSISQSADLPKPSDF